MTERDEQLMRDVVSALSTAMVQIVRVIENQTGLQRQAVIAALKDAGNRSFTFSKDPGSRQMQLQILSNIAVEMENGAARPDRITIPPQ